ncbi:DUF4365 domain-containing protein [Hydrogenophaga sp.]|uniref:DUF4365 domain-containing protein n=1 Tax=Hydrogenophaga sp. TaxID=1904254 RepID=UPI0027169325|nr:DUF4365 domain-containing protein [Hydrogenophaga sp.]MDO9505878.1 DUF4365 domain-containing protein [Hydrogenophaga sp.]
MPSAKKRPDQHIIDQDGQQLLREKLPKAWLLREYRPDYGLDFTVEVFKTLEPIEGRRPMHETLGEHFFVQLKSIDDPLAYSTRWRTRFQADGGQCSTAMADTVPR